MTIHRCKVCDEKEKEIKRILLSYKKEKKLLMKIIGVSNIAWAVISLFILSGKLETLINIIVSVINARVGG